MERIDLSSVGLRQEANSILLVRPEHYRVVDVKNPYMKGNMYSVDFDLALDQWETIKDIYDSLARRGMLREVATLEGVPGLEDMVFCANQTFPWVQSDGTKLLVLSNMTHPSRMREVPHFVPFFESRGYQVIHLQKGGRLEGMGDLIPHPGKRLIWAGYGFRSDEKGLDELEEIVDAPLVRLSLVSPHFYHLDTCFSPVSEDCVMICREAFSPEALRKIESIFNEVVDIPLKEARESFGLNGNCLDLAGMRVAVLQKGTTLVAETLSARGFEILEVETSEFIKGGGSVFCMKLMYY